MPGLPCVALLVLVHPICGSVEEIGQFEEQHPEHRKAERSTLVLLSSNLAAICPKVHSCLGMQADLIPYALYHASHSDNI